MEEKNYMVKIYKHEMRHEGGFKTNDKELTVEGTDLEKVKEIFDDEWQKPSGLKEAK